MATEASSITSTSPSEPASPNPPTEQTSRMSLARWTPSLPTDLMNMLNPFAHGDDTASKSETSEHTHLSSKLGLDRLWRKSPDLDLAATGLKPPRQPSPRRKAMSAMYDEPDTHSTSEISSMDGKERVKRSSRPKTCYSICHPPRSSAARQKLHRRPRALLQLHKLNPNARPLPAFEVVHSAHFSVRLTRAISKVFKHGLCPKDLVILKADDYNADEDEEKEADDMIGLICKGRKDDEGKARILTPSGKEWDAYPISNGGYEFSSTSAHGLGLTVRWIPKRNKDGSKIGENGEARKFNFSTISTASRRHPVIATLSKTQLEICDTYKLPEPAASTPLSTPQRTGSMLAEALEHEGDKDLCETDDQLREVIILTGIWIAFKEGWSPNLKYDTKESSALSTSPSKSAVSGTNTPPDSPGLVALDRRSSLRSIGSGIIHPGTFLARNRHSTGLSLAESIQSTEPDRSRRNRFGRSRGDSTSTVLVHRAAENRRKSHHAVIPSMPDGLPADSHLDASTQSSPTFAEDPVDVSGRPSLPPLQTSNLASPHPLVVDPQHTDSGLSGLSDGGDQSASTSMTDTPTREGLKLPRVSLALKSKRKSGSWRRLFCGAGNTGTI